MGYTGTCFTCGDRINVNDLIPVPRQYGQILYYLCDKCHCPLWHDCHGDEREMVKQLDYTAQRRERMGYTDTGQIISREVNDLKRVNRIPITLEEVAELCWELTYNDNWIEKIK